ncbi:MAG TPA: hypothetical protein VIZ28_17655 [Chitinophagaceae bacterium]
MSTKESTGKKVSKKEARQMVYDRLVVALAEFKTGIKDKKFESNLQKASKLFADDIVKAAGKTKDKTKKTAKKKNKPAEETKVTE